MHIYTHIYSYMYTYICVLSCRPLPSLMLRVMGQLMLRICWRPSRTPVEPIFRESWAMSSDNYKPALLFQVGAHMNSKGSSCTLRTQVFSVLTSPRLNLVGYGTATAQRTKMNFFCAANWDWPSCGTVNFPKAFIRHMSWAKLVKSPLSFLNSDGWAVFCFSAPWSRGWLQ